MIAVHKICRMGNPVLRAENQDLSKEDILSEDFRDLIQDMLDTMNELGGIGIAAPQIGINKKVTILLADPEAPEPEEESPEQALLIIVNPKISVLDESLQGFWEGCLSVPGLRGYVERPRQIQVDYLDENGDEQSLIASDFLATVFQHEIDHLFGALYVDKVKDKTMLSYDEEYVAFQLDQSEE
jgi:peptide deformylase